LGPYVLGTWTNLTCQRRFGLRLETIAATPQGTQKIGHAPNRGQK